MPTAVFVIAGTSLDPRTDSGVKGLFSCSSVEDAVENRSFRRLAGRFDFRDEQFERLGLHRTNEPMHVYCDRCGGEIDPWRAFDGDPRSWWRCPRGCNEPRH
jgi:hypothetical protein